MILENLTLQNFRNYERVHLTFSKKINIFIGKNAQGKTNILESIYVLAITKSHRLFIQDKLIKEGTDYSKVEGIVVQNNRKNKFSIVISNQGKTVNINGLQIKKISEYISALNVIIYSPDDIDLIKGAPSTRRKFLNIEIGQLYSKYFNILNQYHQILKNRNEYLKSVQFDTIDKDYLQILNKQFVEKAAQLYKIRKSFIDRLNLTLLSQYKEIAGEDSLQLKYETSITLEGIEDHIRLVEERLVEKLKSNYQREVLMGATLIGPHRDDFCFLINGENIRDYGSQGQQKMAIISLKFSELNVFKEVKKDYPILLLDDIFSELDEFKKNNIIKCMNLDVDTFITSTDVSKIDPKILQNADIFYIEKAEIKKR